MLDPRFVIVGALLGLYGCIVYAVSTFRGETQPNRVSWLMWSIAPLIAFAAELAQGVGLASLYTLSAGLGPLIVLVSSISSRRAYWKISRLDIACGLLSALALVLWLVTRTGNVAIVFSILADLLAAAPTILKSYRFPSTEHSAPFAMGAVGAGITLLTVTTWNFATYAFPVYLCLCNLLIALLVQFPKVRPGRVAA